jgi:phenylacetate-CoA ligase
MKPNFVELLFLLADKLLGTTVIKNLNDVRNISQYQEHELIQLQHKKLQIMLNHALQKSSYYKALTIHSHSTSTAIELLNQFPILTKKILREHFQQIVAVTDKNLITYETSGSSGMATKVLLDKEEESICRAILIAWWEWCGYSLGKPIFQTGMTTKRGLIKSVKDFITRTQYMDAFHLSEETILRYLKKLPQTGFYLGGYASSLYEIAKVAHKYNLNISFEGAISWGDKMFDHYMQKIEHTFNTKVYENYGCNEGIMIGQKVDLPYFYVYTPNVYIEIVDDNYHPVPNGQIGKVIATKLDGFVTPLVRYETGDLAIMLPKEKYPEQRRFNFPLLEKVIGRDTDIVVTPEGNKLIVHAFTGIFEFYQEIIQFRVIQSELSKITIEYIPDTAFYTDVLNKIEQDIHNKTSTTIEIDWQQVMYIPNSPSGKPQLIINHYLKNISTH